MAKSKAVARRTAKTTEEATALAPIDNVPEGFRVKKKVTVPTLKFPAGSRICIKILSPIREGRALTESRTGNPTNKMGPAQVMQVCNADGEVAQLVVAKVLQSELQENYPNDDYVDRWFVIRKVAAVGDKRYSTFEIDEIEDPTI